MYNQFAQANPMEAIRRNRMSVKGFLGTSNALSIAVLYIISLVLSIITPIFTSPLLTNIMAELYDEMGLDVAMSSGISITIPVLPILTLIAFFLLYSAGKNKNPDTPNSAGATMLMVVSIIQLVLFCLLMVVMVIIIILLIAFASSAANSVRYYNYSYGFINSNVDTAAGAVIIASIIALVISLAVLALYFVYFIGMVRFSSSLKKGLTTPELTAKGAKSVGVCNVFFAVFSGFGVLGNLLFAGCALTSSTAYGYMNASKTLTTVIGLILGLVGSVITFVLYISLAKFAFSFNKHVQSETYSTVAPVAPVYSAPVQPVAPVYSAPVYETTKEAEEFDANEFVPYDEPPATQDPNYIDTAEECLPVTETTDASETSVEPITVQNTCPACGTETIPNQAFCAECGYKLN